MGSPRDKLEKSKNEFKNLKAESRNIIDGNGKRGEAGAAMLAGDGEGVSLRRGGFVA